MQQDIALQQVTEFVWTSASCFQVFAIEKHCF